MRLILLSILLSFGYGKIVFIPHSINGGEKGILSIHATDLNGDGNTDLLFSSIESNSITWLENKGNNSYAPHPISIKINGSVSVFPTDLNGDGNMDVLSASRYDNSISWYKNDGNGIFFKQLITKDANGPWAVYAEDIDGDGDVDVLSVNEYDNTIVWYSNNGKESFKANTVISKVEDIWTIYAADVDFDGDVDILTETEDENNIIWYENNGEAEPSFTFHDWLTSSVNAEPYTIIATDLDDDGDEDIVSDWNPYYDSNATSYLHWRENNGAEQPSFSGVNIALDSAGPCLYACSAVEVADLDGDGDFDLVGGSRYEARLFWYENKGMHDGAFKFTERPIDVSGRNHPWTRGPRRLTGMNLEFADLNHDRRLDIVLQESTSKNVWLEQPQSLNDAWKIHLIGDIHPDRSTGLLLTDIDGDGDLDLFNGGYSGLPRNVDGSQVTPSSPVGRLAWFENPNNPKKPWKRHDISRRVRGMYDEFSAHDMDGDGDIDLIGTRGNSGEFDGVFWLEQLRTNAPQKVFLPARTMESRQLPLPPVSVPTQLLRETPR